jgi:hypothetical protein
MSFSMIDSWLDKSGNPGSSGKVAGSTASTLGIN